MEEETLSKELQKKLAIRLLGKEIPIMGYKDGKYQVIGSYYEFEGKKYLVEEG